MKALKPFETSVTPCPATVSHPRRLESSAARFREAPAPCRSAVCPLQVVKPTQTSVETVGLPAGFEPWFPNYITQPTRRILTWKRMMWRRISQPSAERSCLLNTRPSDSGQCSNTTACRRTKRCTRVCGFRLPENCDLLGYYAACSGNSLSTFRDNISVPSSGAENPNRKPVTPVPHTTRWIWKCRSFPCFSRVNSTAVFRFELRAMCSSRHAGMLRISKKCQLMRQHDFTKIGVKGLGFLDFLCK